MLLIASARVATATLILATLGCASAQTATRTGKTPNVSTTGIATRSATPQKAPSMHTVTVARGKPATITDESLRIELVSVKDDSCPLRSEERSVGKEGVVTCRSGGSRYH